LNKQISILITHSTEQLSPRSKLYTTINQPEYLRVFAVKTGEKLRKIHFHPTPNAPLLLKAQEKSERKKKIS